MKKILVVLYLLMFFTSISAQDIKINYPEKVSAGEEFEVNLKLIEYDSANYDIKIDITKDGERVSRILVDEEWKSTFYYVKNAIVDEEKFILKISEECEGEVDMIVRVRRSGGSSSELFGGYTTEVASGEIDDSENNEEDKKEAKEEDEGEREVPNLASTSTKNDIPLGDLGSKSTIKLEFNESKSIKSESSTNFYKNLFGLSGIFMISVFIGMVYIKKQGKYKNEFR